MQDARLLGKCRSRGGVTRRSNLQVAILLIRANPVEFISREIEEFEKDYASKDWRQYKEDTKLSGT